MSTRILALALAAVLAACGPSDESVAPEAPPEPAPAPVAVGIDVAEPAVVADDAITVRLRMPGMT